MKKLLLASFAAFLTLVSFAQSEVDMKAWQAYMTPGEMHKRMAASAGNWKSEITLWMAPGAPPTKSTGTAKNEMILGSRYLQSTNTGNFMGMPFEGTSITAYDNAKKVFINTWVDNMGTGVMIAEGKWNPAKNAIEFKGMQPTPEGKDVKFRETFTFNADGSQTLEMWIEMAGKEFKSMEIKYTKG